MSEKDDIFDIDELFTSVIKDEKLNDDMPDDPDDSEEYLDFDGNKPLPSSFFGKHNLPTRDAEEMLREAITGGGVISHSRLAGHVKVEESPLDIGENAEEIYILDKSKRREVPKTLLVAAALVIAGLVLFFVINSSTQSVNDRISSSIQVLKEEDAVVRTMDRQVSKLVASDHLHLKDETVEDLSNIISSVSKSEAELNTARDVVSSVTGSLGDDKTTELADAVIQGVDTRIKMLNYGTSMIRKNFDAIASNKALSKAVETNTEADKFIGESEATRTQAIEVILALPKDAKEIDEGTLEALRISYKLDRDAKQKLDETFESIEMAQTLYVEADFSALTSCLKLKQSALDASLAFEDAALAGNIKDSTAQAKGLKKAWKTFFDAAKTLPQDFELFISGPLKSSIEKLNEAYKKEETVYVETGSVIRALHGF